MRHFARLAALAGLFASLASPSLATRPDGHTTLPQSSPTLTKWCGGILDLCTWCSQATKICYQVTSCDGTHCNITILYPDVLTKPQGSGTGKLQANGKLPGAQRHP